MASFKTRGLMSIIISTNLFHFGVADDSTHYFTLPEGCSNDSVSTDPWTCLSYNWGSMSCWFNIGNLFHYQMDVGVNIRSIVFYNIGGFYKTKNITSIGKCLMVKDDLELSGHCYFNITLMSPENKRLRTEVIEFESRHFVKPPKSKGFQYNTTKTSLSLQFQLVRNVYEKEIRIRYQSEYDRDKENGWQEKREIWKRNFNHLFPRISQNRDFSDFIFHMQLRNLTAFTSYDIIVDLIPCNNGTREGFWSDHFNITVKTDDDVPADVPEFYPGYFTHINNSYLQIYWKPISPVKRCGIITNYRVTVNSVGNDEAGKKKIIIVSPNKTSYGLSVDQNQITRIELTQKTRLGYPNNSDAGINVFPENLRPRIPKTFSIHSVVDSRVVMTWGTIGSVKQHGLFKIFSSITVVWCYGTLPGYCSKPIKSRVISLLTKTTSNNTTITVEIGNVWNYIYGISVEAETNDRRLISSGIHWYNDCLYSQDGMPTMAPRAHASWYSHSKMLVKWEPYTCVQSVVEIDKYLIKYCETTGQNCTGERRMEVVPPDMFSHIISGLKEGHSYAIQVGTQLKHSKYMGHWSAKIYLYIPPLNLSYKLQLVVGFVVGGVTTFVILIILAIFFIRRCLKKSNAGVAEINVPHMKLTCMNKTIHQSESEESSGKKDTSSNDSGIGSNLQHNSVLLSDPLGSVSSVTIFCIHDLNEDVLFNSDVSKPPVQVDSDEDFQGLDADISSNTLNSAGYREVDMVSSSDDELELSLLSSDSG